MKFEQKLKAISLRKKGYSYRQIKKNVPVSRSTLSRWLCNLDITNEQRKELFVLRDEGRVLGAQSQRLKRLKQTEVLLKVGTEDFFKLYENPLFLSGLSLYWAEGDKHKAEAVKFTNSDPLMISLMMKWFREICKIPEDKFRIGLHIHSLHINKDVKKYWSKITGIKENQFHKTYVKQTSLGQRKKVLYNGTCAIRIYSKELFRRIMGWRQGLLKYFGLSSP